MLKKIIFDEKKGEREGGEREKEWVGRREKERKGNSSKLNTIFDMHFP